MKSIYNLLIGLAIGALLVWFLIPDPEVQTLKEKDKVIKKNIDSLSTIALGQRSTIQRLRDTIEFERAQKAKFEAKAKRSKREVIYITSKPQIELPDSLATIDIIRQRLEDDGNRIWALQRYADDLEGELYHANQLIHAQDSSLKVCDIMNETKDLITKQWEARFENQVKQTKEQKKGKRKWRVVALIIGAAWITTEVLK